MTTYENIYSQIKTTHELLINDETPRSIQQLQRSKQLISLRKGIYFPTAVWRGLRPWEQQVARVFAVSKARPDSVLSHTSAALLFDFVTPAESLVHVYSAPNSRCKVVGVQKHMLLSAQTPVIRFDYGVRATSPLATAVDSIRMLPFRSAVALADSALGKGVATQDLSDALASSSGRNCRTMKLVAESMSEKSESAGESYTRLILDEMGLTYTEQKELVVDGIHYRCDFALEEFGIIVEFDGRLKLTDFGASDAVLERERYREKALQNAGWVVFRVDWDTVTRRPEDFKQNLRRLLRRNRF